MISVSHDGLHNNIIDKVIERKSLIRRKLLTWGDKNSPLYPWRKNITPYKILISELLLRKTRVGKVNELFPVFLQKFPTINHISKSSIEELRNTIFVLGRLGRDREIMNVSKTISKKFSGNIPRSDVDLFDVIGKQSIYTVNAILCFAYGERVPIFDVNVNRILSRIFTVDFGKQPHKNENAWKLVQMILPKNRIKDFNWALLDLGIMICKSNPKCEICPLSTVCDYAKERLISQEQSP